MNRNIIITISITVIVMFLIIASCTKSPEDRVQSLYTDGEKLLAAYQLDSALQRFPEINEIIPESPLGLYGRGLTLERMFCYYDALHEYMVLNEASPSFGPAFARSWSILTSLGEYQDAMLPAQALLEIEPYNPEYKILAGNALININQYNQARKMLDSAINLGADPNLVNVIKARSFFYQDRMDTARVLISACLGNPSETPVFHEELANYYELTGQIDSAMTHSRKSYQLSEYDFVYVLAHFERSLNNGYYHDARKVISDFKAKGFSPASSQGMILHYHLSRKDKSLAKNASDQFGTYKTAILNPAYYDMITSGAEHDEQSVLMNYINTKKYMETNNFNKAFQDFMMYRATLAFAEFGDNFLALKNISNMQSKYNSYRDILLAQIKIYGQVGDFDNLNTLMDKMKELHSRKADWLTGMGNIYGNFDNKKYKTAGEMYDLALTLDKWHLPAMSNHVLMWKKTGNYKKALDVLDRYAYFTGQYPRLKALKSIILLQDNKPDSAITLFKESFPYLRGDINIFKEFVTLLDNKNMLKQRDLIYEFALQLSPENTDLLYLSAKTIEDKKNYKEMKAIADRLLALEPDNNIFKSYQAYSMFHNNEKEKAFEIFENIYNNNHFHPENNYYYSKAITAEGGDYNRAGNIARSSLSLSNQDINMWANLCECYLGGQRFDLCLGEANKMEASYPDHPLPYYYQGIASYKLGREDTKALLEKAVKLGLRDEEFYIAKNILSKL